MEDFKGTRGDWKVERTETDSSRRACYRVSTSVMATQAELNHNSKLIESSPNMLNSLQETSKSISLMKGCLSTLSDDTRELEDILENWKARNQEVINKAL